MGGPLPQRTSQDSDGRPRAREVIGPRKVLTDLHQLFSESGVDYMLVGGLASSIWGVPRVTIDFDLVTRITEDGIKEFAACAVKYFELDEQALASAVSDPDEHAMFQLLHSEEFFKVDAFLLRHSEHQQIAFARRRTLDAGEGLQLWFESPEDTVLQKLSSYELGNRVSERQWADALNVMRVQGEKLDVEYMNRWADQLGIVDLLLKARAMTSD